MWMLFTAMKDRRYEYVKVSEEYEWYFDVHNCHMKNDIVG